MLLWLFRGDRKAIYKITINYMSLPKTGGFFIEYFECFEHHKKIDLKY
jgi:hypothetical protein